MITVIASLVGFLSSAFPELLRLFRDHQDRQHELKILALQLEQQKQGHVQRLEEINAGADISESKALYKTYYSGIRWVDALNGSVRPVLAYAFFLLYAFTKCSVVMAYQGLPWQPLWMADDQAIFAGIISFYFGQRAMAKVRK
jgi:hypothetical protein